MQLGIEYYPGPPAFARESVAATTGPERDLVLAFEAGAPQRLAAARVPWDGLAL